MTESARSLPRPSSPAIGASYVVVAANHANFPGVLQDPGCLTILRRAGYEPPLAKTFRRDATGAVTPEPIHFPRDFEHQTWRLVGASAAGLLSLLRRLEADPTRCVIRGAIRPECFGDRTVQRRQYRCGTTGAGGPFVSAKNGRTILCLDIDDFVVPTGVDPRADAVAAVRLVRSALPEPFRSATCVYQWSNSMGLGRDAWTALKLHLWFLLKQPMTDADLAAWAKGDPAAAIVDRKLFHPVQPIFTSAPCLGPGIEDPFGSATGRSRSGLVEGADPLVDLLSYIVPFLRPGRRATTAPSPQVAAPAALDEAVRRVANAREHERNDTLNREAFGIGRLVGADGLKPDDALDRLVAAARSAALPETEARRTAQSGLDAGIRVGQDLGDLLELGTERWVGRRLVKKHGADLRYVGAWQKWLVWDEAEGRWREDSTGEVFRRAQSVVDDLILLSHSLTASGAPQADEIAAAARRFQSKSALKNAVELASVEAAVVAKPEQWDRDPWLLNVANGTIDLRTGTLRPHRREDYIRKRCAVAYDATAPARTFLKFTTRILPDPDVLDYVQRFLGYGLTGEVGEHLVHFFCGSGANGKSTLLDAIRHVLGDYAVTVPANLLMEGAFDRHPTELARLHGARLAICPETVERGAIDESRLKALSGGDRITARRMREDFWDFPASHKLLFATNRKPRVSGTSEAIGRRLRVVPFTVTVPTSERDVDLPRKLEAEAAGILAWLVAGALSYVRRRLVPPEAVRAATADYRDAEEVLREFVEARLLRTIGAFCSHDSVFRAYVAWCDARHVPEFQRLSQREFCARLVERGFARGRRKDARGFLGIAVGRTGDKR